MYHCSMSYFLRLRYVALCATLRQVLEREVSFLPNGRIRFLQSQERVREINPIEFLTTR